MQNALITGATGFIGFELARNLAAAGIRPRLMVRRHGRAALLRPLDAELIQADLTSEPSLRRATEGVDTVFHLGARATFESYRKLRDTNVLGSQRLMRAAIDSGIERFVFASSLFVHGSQQEPITAHTEPSPALGYGVAKLEAERSLETMADDAGISFATVRLPHVYGAQSLLFGQLRKGLVIFPGRMTNEFALLHVRDAARLLIAVARQGWTGASAVADRRPADWIEFFDTVSELYPRFRLIRIPQVVGHLGARALSPFLYFRSRPTLYASDTVTGFNLNLPVDPTLIWSDLGIEPAYPTIHEGIQAALDDSLQFRWCHPVLDRVG